MKPLLLALLLAAACKHSSSSSASAHTETSIVTDSTSSESGAVTTTTTQTEGPSKTVTVTEEYGPPEPPNRGTPGAQDAPSAPLPHGVNDATLKLPRRGPLVKRTVTTTEHAADTTQTTQEATSQGTAATETHAQAQVDAKAQEAEKGAPALSCAFGGWLAIAGVVAALFGLGYFAIKRLRTPV